MFALCAASSVSVGSARGADTLKRQANTARLRKLGRSGFCCVREQRVVYARACRVNYEFLNRQAAQLQREAVSARLRSGAEAPGPTHKRRGVMALAGRSRRLNVSRGKRHAARDFVARPWRCSLR
jgi:hypothetical protein